MQSFGMVAGHKFLSCNLDMRMQALAACTKQRHELLLDTCLSCLSALKQCQERAKECRVPHHTLIYILVYEVLLLANHARDTYSPAHARFKHMQQQSSRTAEGDQELLAPAKTLRSLDMNSVCHT